MDVIHQLWACERNTVVSYLEHRERFADAGPEILEKHAYFVGSSEELKEILTITGNVASIEIKGVLTQSGPDFWDRLFGFDGTSFGDIIDAANKAGASDEVDTVYLYMNTPGGEVAGLDHVNRAIAELAKRKQVIAVNEGMIASAGYWIASAANQILATSPTDETGSIGVVTVAIDRSKRDGAMGRVTIISSNAPNKRPNAGTSEGRQVIQDELDAMERVFTSRVAEGRGVSREHVEQTYGRGALLIASDPDASKPSAIKAGMIDGFTASARDFETDGLSASGFETGGLSARDFETDGLSASGFETGGLSASGFETGGLSASGFETDGLSASDFQSLKAAYQANEAPEANADTEPPCAAEETNMSEELKKEIQELKEKFLNATAAQEETNARMEAVAPILASDSYPQAIKEIAGKVLAGEENREMLRGAIAMFDAQKAANDLEKADAESKEAPDSPLAPAGVATPSADGSIDSPEAYFAELKRMKIALKKGGE